MEKEQRAKLILVALCVMFISVGLFLGFNYAKINKDGLKCLNDPIGWAQERITQVKGKDFVCSCEKDAEMPKFNISFDFGGQNG